MTTVQRMQFDDEVLTAFGGEGGGGGGGGNSTTVNMCTGASIGGQSFSTCINSDGTTSTHTCVGTPGPLSATLCVTSSSPSINPSGSSKAESNWSRSNDFAGISFNGRSGRGSFGGRGGRGGRGR